MRILIRIVRSSVILALQELVKNKLRSFLSLLGITIGILCIISVLTAVDSLKRNLLAGFAALGSEVVYVQKWPIMFTDDYPWWKFWQRPEVTYDEFEALEEQLQTAKATAMMSMINSRVVKNREVEVRGVTVAGVTHGYDQVRDFIVEHGRYFTMAESQLGRNIAVLGYSVANSLFDAPEQAVGSSIKCFGRDVLVVGVLKEEGSSMIDLSLDNNILTPLNYVKSFIDISNTGPLVAVVAREGIPVEEMKYEISGLMRQMRKLKPAEEDNFAVNEISVITEGLSSVFGVVSIAGVFIGIFSILVGGFGIANIMFVSVKERTPIIGIKKALGARKQYILIEFLVEAVVLCLLGGIAGLFFVYLLFGVLQFSLLKDSTFTFTVSAFYVTIGVALSVGIGLIAGIVPAILASLMKPVEAIRAK